MLGVIGLVITLIGIAIGAWGMLTFARAHTAIVPIRPASRLVQHGPYRFTRNPMYSGLTFAYLGVAALFNLAWAILVLPVVVLGLRHFVIAREEAYLQREFGREYDDYRRRVRRWL
jgi:protein-S-isoprenylcysteine O-methyltransferase Ste14